MIRDAVLCCGVLCLAGAGVARAQASKVQVQQAAQQLHEGTQALALLRYAALAARLPDETGLSQEEVFSILERRLREIMVDHRQIREQIALLNKALRDHAADRALRPYLLYGLMAGWSLAGEPERALHFHQLLAQEFADHPLCRRVSDDVEPLRQGAKALAEIRAKTLAPDQRLWETGMAYARMMRVSWNEMEVGYDQNISVRLFNDLLTRYPQSDFADNAWWELNPEGDWAGSEDGREYLAAVLPTYEEFLRRYPRSELAPLAKWKWAVTVSNAVQAAEAGQVPPEHALPVGQRRLYLLRAQTMMREAIQAGLSDDYLARKCPLQTDLVNVISALGADAAARAADAAVIDQQLLRYPAAKAER